MILLIAANDLFCTVVSSYLFVGRNEYVLVKNLITRYSKIGI